MALNFKKSRISNPEPNTTVVEGLSDISEFHELIDQIGEGDAEYAKRAKKIKDLEALQKPHEELLKTLVEKITAIGNPDEKVRQLGETYQVDAGKRSVSRTVTDLEGVHKILGDEAFLKLVSIKLSDVDQYLTGQQVKAVVTTDRGNRSSVKVTKRV